jgi:sigma-B regulation protein RsbU (phosphoserine phosphatase)
MCPVSMRTRNNVVVTGREIHRWCCRPTVSAATRIRGASCGPRATARPAARFAAVDVRVEAGDTVLRCTDGLTEARTRGRARYREEQLRADPTGLAPATAGAVVEAVTDLPAGFGDGVEDDTALPAFSIPRPGGDQP